MLIEYVGRAETASVEPGCAIGTEDFPMSWPIFYSWFGEVIEPQ